MENNKPLWKGFRIEVDHKVRRSFKRDIFTLSLHSGDTTWESCDFSAASGASMAHLSAALWLLDQSHSVVETQKYDFFKGVLPEGSLLEKGDLMRSAKIQQDIIYRIGKSIFFPSGLPICTLFPLTEEAYIALKVPREEEFLLNHCLPLFTEYGTETLTNEDTEEDYEVPVWPWDSDSGSRLKIYVEGLTYTDKTGIEWPCSYSFEDTLSAPTIAHINTHHTDSE